MKLTIYCDKDLVLRYSPEGWPIDPYTASLQKAKYESIPFEDQRDIAARIAKANVLQLNNFKVPDTFYGLDLDGDVKLWVPAHPDCDGGKKCIKNCHSVCENLDEPKIVARIIPTKVMTLNLHNSSEITKREIDREARKCASKVLGIHPDKIIPDDTIMYGFKAGVEYEWSKQRDLRNFYDWYREANAATREDVLNELKRILEIE